MEDKVDTERKMDKVDELFSADNIEKVVQLFKEADVDGGRGIGVDEFCDILHKIEPNIETHELRMLHMKICTNSDTTVDVQNLINYLRHKKEAIESLEYRHNLFPKPFHIIRQESSKKIVRLLFRPLPPAHIDEHHYKSGEVRQYQKCQYLSITSNGILKWWNHKFETDCTFHLYEMGKTIPFAHKKKMQVTDMVCLKEVNELAISTAGRELVFYECHQFYYLFKIKYSVIVDDCQVSTLHFWCDGRKAAFAFGDVRGYLSVFTTQDIKQKGLFLQDAFEKISLTDYPTVYAANLLRATSNSHRCHKVSIFADVCSDIQYFQHIESYVVCSTLNEEMVVANVQSEGKPQKTSFVSCKHQGHFACVEYCSESGYLVTGGTDGVIRMWNPAVTSFSVRQLERHVKPVTHIVYNLYERVIISASTDMNVCVWSEDDWLCKQSIHVTGMTEVPLSTMCYNMYNNEIFLATSNIGKCLGKGTDVFKRKLTSHQKPLCCALYHDIFKQVVSVCQDGVVKLWDVSTGTATIQFKVTPEQYVGLTAMSFDEAKCRLITISKNGEVRLWNFNSGEKLKVISLTLPNYVTGIICDHNRLFVSANSSPMVFNLDLEGEDHRFYKHHLLDNVSSMDLHNFILVAMSSLGNVVFWNLETADVVYYIISGESQPQTAFKEDQGSTGSVTNDQLLFHSKCSAHVVKESDIHVGPHVLILKTREVVPHMATVLTLSGGFIYAWSVYSEEGLMAKFRAVTEEGAYITAWSMDKEEQILVTGDSTGRVCLWDFEHFCVTSPSDKGLYENTGGRCPFVSTPPLLNSWQAHQDGLSSVVCDEACENVFTTSSSCDLKMWTKAGRCVGVFGKDEWDATHITRL